MKCRYCRFLHLILLTMFGLVGGECTLSGQSVVPSGSTPPMEKSSSGIGAGANRSDEKKITVGLPSTSGLVFTIANAKHIVAIVNGAVPQLPVTGLLRGMFLPIFPAQLGQNDQFPPLPKRTKEQVERLLVEERVKFEIEENRLSVDASRLETEFTGLTEKVLIHRTKQNQNREDLSAAKKTVERLERDKNNMQQRIDHLSAVLSNGKSRLTEIEGENDRFLNTFRDHVQIDVKAGFGFVYRFGITGSEFLPPPSPRNAKPGQQATEMYDSVLAHVLTNGEFPPINNIDPRQGVIPLKKEQFESFNATAREIHRLKEEATSANSEYASAAGELTNHMTRYRTALAQLQQHEEMRTTLEDNSQELIRRRSQYTSDKQKHQKREKENRVRREFIDLAEHTLQLSDSPALLGPTLPRINPFSDPAVPSPEVNRAMAAPTLSPANPFSGPGGSSVGSPPSNPFAGPAPPVGPPVSNPFATPVKK
jgi:hypothetical protein